MLVIPLADIDDDGYAVDASVPVSSLQPEDVDALPVETVNISGEITEVAGDYLFQGEISGCFEHACDRCLRQARMPFEVEAIWNFETDPKAAFEAAGVAFDEEIDLGDSAMCRPILNEEIDLRPHLWEELVLAFPSKFLCSEDCQGICPGCGANLNDGECGCPPAEAAELPGGNAGLLGLAELFPDLAPGKDRPQN